MYSIKKNILTAMTSLDLGQNTHGAGNPSIKSWYKVNSTRSKK